MAHNKNSRKSEGLCQKIHNAVSPFKSKIRRISHQPQLSISVTSDINPPTRISSPQTKPVRILHQSSKMIPVEFNHFAAQNTKKTQSAGKENSTDKTGQELGDKEILIVRGQMFGSRKRGAAPPAKVEKVGPDENKLSKAGASKTDDTIHDGRFSDYINKVKNRMMKTDSNVGGGGGGVEKTLSLK